MSAERPPFIPENPERDQFVAIVVDEIAQFCEADPARIFDKASTGVPIYQRTDPQPDARWLTAVALEMGNLSREEIADVLGYTPKSVPGAIRHGKRVIKYHYQTCFYQTVSRIAARTDSPMR